jgi:hypothetical protein
MEMEYILESMTTPKALIQSWTFWFGLLQIALGAVGFLSGLMDHSTAISLITTGIGTIGFRLKTSQPIGGIVAVD